MRNTPVKIPGSNCLSFWKISQLYFCLQGRKKGDKYKKKKTIFFRSKNNFAFFFSRSERSDPMSVLRTQLTEELSDKSIL